LWWAHAAFAQVVQLLIMAVLLRAKAAGVLLLHVLR
jgi:hypothetical protein